MAFSRRNAVKKAQIALKWRLPSLFRGSTSSSRVGIGSSRSLTRTEVQAHTVANVRKVFFQTDNTHDEPAFTPISRRVFFND